MTSRPPASRCHPAAAHREPDGKLEQAQRGAAGKHAIEPGMAQHAVGRDERDVHVRALTDESGLVDEHAVVEPRFLRLHLHQDVGQIVGRLRDRVERRLDRICRRHHAQTIGVPTIRIREPAEHDHEEARLGASGRREIQVAGTSRQPVADRSVAGGRAGPSARIAPADAEVVGVDEDAAFEAWGLGAGNAASEEDGEERSEESSVLFDALGSTSAKSSTLRRPRGFAT